MISFVVSCFLFSFFSSFYSLETNQIKQETAAATAKQFCCRCRRICLHTSILNKLVELLYLIIIVVIIIIIIIAIITTTTYEERETLSQQKYKIHVEEA